MYFGTRRLIVFFVPCLSMILLGLLLLSMATPVAAEIPAHSSTVGVVSDDFNACTLNANLWNWDDPQEGTDGEATYRLADNRLEISVPGGMAHDVVSGTHLAPNVTQVVNDGNFSVQMRLTSSITDGIQTQGFLATEDSNNFLRVYFEHDGTAAHLTAERVNDANVVEFWSHELDPSDGQGPVYLRIERVGSHWLAQYSFDGFGWTGDEMYDFDDALAVAAIGVFAGNAGPAPAPAHIMQADYFFNETSPIVPQDAVVLRFADLDDSGEVVSPPNAGRVDGGPLNPTPGNPECGTPLQITAIPTDGWTLDLWQIRGSSTYTSTSNPLVSEFFVGDSVSAWFRRVFYLEVGVDGDGEGTISRTPDQTTYDPGQAVELLALPAVGSFFVQWNGDVPAGQEAENPLTFIVYNNSAITATFDLVERYELTVTVAGGGSVAIDPELDSYLDSLPVTLTATALEHWSFVQWAGDVPSEVIEQEEIALTMDRNRIVSALFRRSFRQIYLPIISRP